MSKSTKRSETSRATRWRTDKAKAANKRFKASARGRAVQKRVRQKWQAELRALVAQLKSVPCADCGSSFDPVCMDFDHREPGTKREAVSKIFKRGKIAVLAEIAKCDVVCANCHRLRTHRLRDHEQWRNAKRVVAPQPTLQLGLPLPADVAAKVEEQLR